MINPIDVATKGKLNRNPTLIASMGFLGSVLVEITQVVTRIASKMPSRYISFPLFKR
jgi:hypothetical protein